MDGEPGAGLPGQRQEHLRISRHLLSPLSGQGNRRQVLLHRQHSQSESGPTGFPPEAGAYASSGTTTLVTGDVEFLRNRVVPAYKELALFYEDFLTATDKNGNYIFVPSISPENTPASTDPSGPVLVNATMDIAVCREVLTNLIQACETLGTDADSVPKWKAMLAKMPPYLLEPDGTLKEWAWPTLQEHYTHRHVSHLYGAWPGDEIDPDRTPQLARAADDRRPEAHVRCDVHRGRGRNSACLRPLPSRFGRGAAQRQHHRGRPTAAIDGAGLRQHRAPVFARALWPAGAGRAGRNSRDHHGNAGSTRAPE